MSVDPLNIGAILIALFSLLGSWATQRSSAKAALQNTRAAAEVEAYARAVKMDSETIQRQDAEILELRNERNADRKRIKELEDDNEGLHRECRHLRRRVILLEEKDNGQQGV